MIAGVKVILLYRTTCTERGCDGAHEQGHVLSLGDATPPWHPPDGWHVVDGRMVCPQHEVVIGTLSETGVERRLG